MRIVVKTQMGHNDGLQRNSRKKLGEEKSNEHLLSPYSVQGVELGALTL